MRVRKGYRKIESKRGRERKGEIERGIDGTG